MQRIWLLAGIVIGAVGTFALLTLTGADQSSEAPNMTAVIDTAVAYALTDTALATQSVAVPWTVTPMPVSSATHTAAPSRTPTPIRTPTRTHQPRPTVEEDVILPTPTAAEPTHTPVLHIVRRGQTLAGIANAYNMEMNALMQANGLFDSSRILAGQALLIPVPENDNTTVPDPDGDYVEGVPLEEIIVMDADVRKNVINIYAEGQAQGRDPNAFSKLGDSTIENPHFLARFDDGPYNLGPYGELQEIIDHYAGSHGRQGMAVRRGLHSWSIFDPLWADSSVCQPNEDMLACEFRLHNPSVLIVRLGSNDVGRPDAFESNLRRVVEYSIEQGVIPVLGTKADRFDGPSDINNTIIRTLAAEYQVPLWDFDRVAATIPGRGLGPDNVHLSIFYAHDWSSPAAMNTGHGVHNITALMMLDALQSVVAVGDD